MTDTLAADTHLAARIEALAETLEVLTGHLERIDNLLTEFEPVIRAYLDPAAAGPVAWAVRRQQRKSSTDGRVGKGTPK